MLSRFDLGSKWCTHVSSCVTILLRKVLGSACRCPRRSSQMSTRHFICSAVNIRGTQRAEIFFIHECSLMIRCAVLELMHVVSAMCVMVKRLSLFRSSCTAWMFSAVLASFGRLDCGSSAIHFLPRLNSAIHNFTTLYEGAFSPNVPNISAWYPCLTFLSKTIIL